jgi:hypothetical protein
VVPDGWPGTEVGWPSIRMRWGKGYAPKPATAAIDWAFDMLGWTEVIHCISPDNIASQSVASVWGRAIAARAALPPFAGRARDRYLGPDPRGMAGATRRGAGMITLSWHVFVPRAIATSCSC